MKPQLSVRSEKARELAHRLARREQRTVASIVERALEEYEARHAGKQPAADFYRTLQAECGTESDLDALLDEHRTPHTAPRL
ncbi:MAG: plasmid stabilization protein [Gammaproteobacteria bacterium HGW-Gammaproteobacteria-8]|nr:MAG: plasmid stabilization protein [Gammaproteobacteria bacterium HGW-Gammaproteobacteria-8]